MVQVWVCICANSPILFGSLPNTTPDLPVSCMGHHTVCISQMKSSFELFCAFNSLRFSPFLAQNVNFSYLQYQHQMNMLRSYKKLNFYFTFNTDVSISEYLDLIKNEKHCQAVPKLRSSNHKLRIKNDRYHIPKIPENMHQFC